MDNASLHLKWKSTCFVLMCKFCSACVLSLCLHTGHLKNLFLGFLCLITKSLMFNFPGFGFFGKSISVSLPGSKLWDLAYFLIILHLLFAFVTPARSELSVHLPGFAGFDLLGGIGSLGVLVAFLEMQGEGPAVWGLWGEELDDAVCKFLDVLSTPYQRIQGIHDIITKSCSHLFFMINLLTRIYLIPSGKKYESCTSVQRLAMPAPPMGHQVAKQCLNNPVIEVFSYLKCYIWLDEPNPCIFQQKFSCNLKFYLHSFPHSGWAWSHPLVWCSDSHTKTSKND